MTSCHSQKLIPAHKPHVIIHAPFLEAAQLVDEQGAARVWSKWFVLFPPSPATMVGESGGGAGEASVACDGGVKLLEKRGWPNYKTFVVRKEVEKSSLTPKAAWKTLIGCCYPISPNDQGDHNSFGGAQSKRIEGFSTSGYFTFNAKAISREAFNVSFFKLHKTRS